MPSRTVSSLLRAFLCNRKQAFVFLFVFVGILILLYFWTTYTFPKVKAINLSRVRLNMIRGMITSYSEDNNKYPNSLIELKKFWIEKKSNGNEIDVWFFEIFTHSEGIFTESAMLDGQGGLYYKKETGEVRWNVTKPVKYYWKFYFGKGRNEIPSDW